MKSFNKTVLAAAIAIVISSTAQAADIQTGTTGNASTTVNGKDVIIGQTYKVGEMPTLVKVLPAVDMPSELQAINQDSVGMVVFDTKTLSNLKVGEKVELDYLGNPKDGTVMSNVTESNGDKTIVTNNGKKERTILTFGVDGSVVGTAAVDGHNYDVSTDANGTTWMVDNTTSGQAHSGFQNDTHLGAAVSTTPVVAKATIIPVPTVAPTNPNVQLLVYVASSIPNGATVVNNLIAVTNQAFLDSNVKMEVVATKVITVVDQSPTNERVALNILMAGTNGFDTLKADLLASKADLVTFIHPLKKAQGMCGLATLNGGRGAAFSKKYVYSVVSYGTDAGYYCNSWTLAHELGHTMGMVHDAAHSVGVVGHFSDAYGYGLQSAYGDIMSYFPANGVFSTPVKYWNNNSRFPYGVVNKANVARGLNAIATEVAAFDTLTK